MYLPVQAFTMDAGGIGGSGIHAGIYCGTYRPLDTATADLEGAARIMECNGKASSARWAAEGETTWSS